MNPIRPIASVRPFGHVAGLLCAIAVLVGFFGFFAKNFLSTTTLLTIANSIPDITVIAVGMTLVLIAG
ncbi:MAG: ABC transporter permease, partial [Pirellula sp.]